MNSTIDEQIEKQMRLPAAPGCGVTPAACRRRADRTRGVTHSGRPGQVIEMSRGRQYFVMPDGSFRRIRQAA
jgi:hypothetical protein